MSPQFMNCKAIRSLQGFDSSSGAGSIIQSGIIVFLGGCDVIKDVARVASYPSSVSIEKYS